MYGIFDLKSKKNKQIIEKANKVFNKLRSKGIYDQSIICNKMSEEIEEELCQNYKENKKFNFYGNILFLLKRHSQELIIINPMGK